jgi:hypothetical protein
MLKFIDIRRKLSVFQRIQQAFRELDGKVGRTFLVGPTITCRLSAYPNLQNRHNALQLQLQQPQQQTNFTRAWTFLHTRKVSHRPQPTLLNCACKGLQQ